MSNQIENRQRGFIALFRSLQEHWIYPSDRQFTEYEAWIDLLLEANHKPRPVRVKNKIIQCKRGQSVRSLTRWAERWKWSKSKVYRFLELLESDGMIETVSETVTTRISICNYESYQSKENKSETGLEQGQNDPETNPKQLGTESDSNKNENNAKNEKNVREENPPTLEQCIQFFMANNGFREWAERFYNHYQAAEWKTESGFNVAKGWQGKALKWIQQDRQKEGLDIPIQMRENLRKIDAVSDEYYDDY